MSVDPLVALQVLQSAMHNLDETHDVKGQISSKNSNDQSIVADTGD